MVNPTNHILSLSSLSTKLALDYCYIITSTYNYSIFKVQVLESKVVVGSLDSALIEGHSQ